MVRIVDVALGEGQEPGDVRELEERGNEVFLAAVVGGPVDEEFWRSLYKWESESGGDFVSGWITAFFAHTQAEAGPPEPRTDFRWRATVRRWKGRTVETGPARFTENAFPSHLSTVPFDWETPSGRHRMAFVGGVLGIERDGAYVRPRLGNAVLRVLREAPDQAAEQAALAVEQLPPGWTVERVREVIGSRAARLLPTEGLVVVDAIGGGELGRPVAAVRLGMGCLVRMTADGPWLGGMLDPAEGVVHSEGSLGPDLAAALPGMVW